MSVNINFRNSRPEDKWKSLKNGDFAIIEGNDLHPIPTGLYRIFIVPPAQITDDPDTPKFILIPMMEGPFDIGMFPYMITEFPLPTIAKTINKISIDAEVNS